MLAYDMDNRREGLTQTAVTMFSLNEQIDAGDIIYRRPISITAEEQADSVLDKANAPTLAMLEKHLCGALAGTAHRTPQDGSQHSYTRIGRDHDSVVARVDDIGCRILRMVGRYDRKAASESLERSKPEPLAVRGKSKNPC